MTRRLNRPALIEAAIAPAARIVAGERSVWIVGILPSQPSGSLLGALLDDPVANGHEQAHLAADALEVAATHVVADAGEPERLRPGQVPPAGLRLEAADAQLVVAGVADRVGDVLVDPAQLVDHPGEPVHVDRRPVVDRQVDEIADDAGQDGERLVALLPRRTASASP